MPWAARAPVGPADQVRDVVADVLDVGRVGEPGYARVGDRLHLEQALCDPGDPGGRSGADHVPQPHDRRLARQLPGEPLDEMLGVELRLTVSVVRRLCDSDRRGVIGQPDAEDARRADLDQPAASGRCHTLDRAHQHPVLAIHPARVGALHVGEVDDRASAGSDQPRGVLRGADREVIGLLGEQDGRHLGSSRNRDDPVSVRPQGADRVSADVAARPEHNHRVGHRLLSP